MMGCSKEKRFYALNKELIDKGFKPFSDDDFLFIANIMDRKNKIQLKTRDIDRKTSDKLSVSNKYIWFDVDGSSTKSYADQLMDSHIQVNSNEYSDKDVVFVSVNSKGRLTDENLNKTKELIKKALDAGARIVLDTPTNTDNSLYNIDGKTIYEYITKELGYEVYEDNFRGYLKYKVGVTSKSSSVITRGRQEDNTKNITELIQDVIGNFDYINYSEHLGLNSTEEKRKLREYILMKYYLLHDTPTTEYQGIFDRFIKYTKDKYKFNIDLNTKSTLNFTVHDNPFSAFISNYDIIDPQDVWLIDGREKHSLRQAIRKKYIDKTGKLTERQQALLDSFTNKLKKNGVLNDTVNITIKNSSSIGGLGENIFKNPDYDEVIDIHKSFKSLFFGMFNKDKEDNKMMNVTPRYQQMLMPLLDKIEDFYGKNFKESSLRVITKKVDSDTKGQFISRINKATEEFEDVIAIQSGNDVDVSTAQILLHEMMHKIAKGVANNNIKLFDDLKLLRKTIREKYSEQVNANIYLQQLIKNTPDITKLTQEQQDKAIARFDYIMSDEADIEEFFAEVSSHSDIYEIVSQVPLSKDYPDGIKGILLQQLDVIINFITRKANSPYGKEAIDNTIKAIMDYQIKVNLHNEARLIPFFESVPYIGLPIRATNFVFNKAVEVIDFLNKNIGVVVNGKLKSIINKMFEVRDSITNKISNSEMFNKVSSIKILKTNAITELFKSITRSVTYSTSEGKLKDFYKMYRQSIATVDKTTSDLIMSLEDSIKDNEVLKPSNYLLNKNITKHLINNGVIRYIEDIYSKQLFTKENADKFIANTDLNKDVLDKVDDLVYYLVNEEPRNNNTLLSINSILSTSTMRSKANDIETIEAIELLVAVKVMHSNSQVLNTFTNLFKQTNGEYRVFQEVIGISKLLRNQHRKISNAPYNFTNSTNSRYTYSTSEEEPMKDTLSNSMIPLAIKGLNDKTIEVNGKTNYIIKHIDNKIQFEEGMIKLASYRLEGISIRKLLFNELTSESIKRGKDIDVDKINKIVEGLLKRINEKGFDNSIEKIIKYDGFVLPEYNENGRLIDMKIPLTFKDKEALGMSTDIQSIVPDTMHKVITMNIAKENNEKVLLTLNDFYRKYKKDDLLLDDSKEKVEFITVSEKATPTIWNVLPNEVKELINSKYSKRIKVPEKIINQVFGYRMSSLSNIGIIKDKKLKENIRIAEKILGEILSKLKAITVLYNPAVFISNIISNMTIALSYGVTPYEYYRKFKNYWSVLEDYNNTTKELMRLRLDRVKADATGKRRIDNKILVLKNKLDNHVFKDLSKDGQYTPMLEEIEESTNTSILSSVYSNLFKLDDLEIEGSGDNVYIDDYEVNKLVVELVNNGNYKGDYEAQFRAAYLDLTIYRDKGKLPRNSKYFLDILYGNKGTYIHKLASKMVNYSDVITKQMIIDVSKDKFIKLNKRPMNTLETNKILSKMDEIFVNYGYNMSPLMSWLDRVGGLFFMKYYLKSLKGYEKVIKDKPLAIITEHIVQGTTGVDVADPLDTYDHSVIDSIANREVLSSPLDVVWDTTTPNLFMPITELSMNSIYK